MYAPTPTPPAFQYGLTLLFHGDRDVICMPFTLDRTLPQTSTMSKRKAAGLTEQITCKKLIEMVRNIPAICDATLPHYMDAVSIGNSWKSIAEELKIPSMLSPFVILPFPKFAILASSRKWICSSNLRRSELDFVLASNCGVSKRGATENGILAWNVGDNGQVFTYEEMFTSRLHGRGEATGRGHGSRMNGWQA